MNDKIKELADTAGITWAMQTEFDIKNMEQFVESIIKEVIAEFYDEIQYNFSSGYAQEITDKVKKHFGIYP